MNTDLYHHRLNLNYADFWSPNQAAADRDMTSSRHNPAYQPAARRASGLLHAFAAPLFVLWSSFFRSLV